MVETTDLDSPISIREALQNHESSIRPKSIGEVLKKARSERGSNGVAAALLHKHGDAPHKVAPDELPVVETWNERQTPAAVEHHVNAEHLAKARDNHGMGHAEIAGEHVYLHHSGKHVLIRGHVEGVPTDHIHEEAKKQKDVPYAVHA